MSITVSPLEVASEVASSRPDMELGSTSDKDIDGSWRLL